MGTLLYMLVTASLAAISVTAIAQATSAQGSGKYVNGPEGRLFVDDGGSGSTPAVVFIHSFAGSSRHWAAQLAHVRQTRRAVAFDVRGHGRSDPPKSLDAYAVDRMAQDLRAVIEALKLEKVVLVGSSMGGPIALAFARSEPSRVAGIMLVGPPGKTPPEQADNIVSSLEADYKPVSTKYLAGLLEGAAPQTRELITKEFFAFPRDAGIAVIRALFAFDPLAALDAWRGPVLAVTTQHEDQPTDLHRLKPDLPRKVIANTSHWPHLDKPEAFNRVLDEFLRTAAAP